MIPTCHDNTDLIISFLDGTSRVNLSMTCKSFRDHRLLLYDGPVSNHTHVVSHCPEVFARWCCKTPNSFLYCSCPRATASQLRSPGNWITELASDPSVAPSVFLCALAYTGNHNNRTTDDLLRVVADSISSDIHDPQVEKVLFLLHNHTPNPTTLDYLLRLACLRCQLPLVEHIINTYSCCVSTNALMMVLISSDSTPEERLGLVRVLLNNSQDVSVVTGFDYWALKYTLFSNKWDLFKELYAYVLDNDPQRYSEETLCNVLPESVRFAARLEIERYRSSLYAAL